MMQSITAFNQSRVQSVVNKNDTVIDATVGNGRDTLFLAKNALEVHGFDIQKAALNKTSTLIKKHGITNVSFHQMSHHLMDEVIKEEVRAIMFNFGYLPGGDKTKTTLKKTSLIALEKACHLLKPGGIITLALYPGHSEGRLEADAVENYSKALDKSLFHVVCYKPLNVKDSPYSIIIEKRKV